MKSEVKYYNLPSAFVAMVREATHDDADTILSILKRIIAFHDGEEIPADPSQVNPFVWIAIRENLEQMRKSMMERSEKQRENVNKRWNKVVSNTIPTNTTSYQTIPSDTNAYQSIPTDTNDTYKYKDKDKDKDKRISTSSKIDEEFVRFWNAYGKKVGKESALRAWIKAKKDKSFPAIDALISIIARWNALPQWQEEDGKYKPHPATWLNGKRWLDEIETLEPAKEEPLTNTMIEALFAKEENNGLYTDAN